MSSDAPLHVTFDDLAKGDQWRFMWGYLWRGLVAMVASGIGGGIAGGVIGFLVAVVAQSLGKSLDDVLPLIRVLSLLAGATIGFIVVWQLVRWLFRAPWFGYRLRLVKDAV